MIYNILQSANQHYKIVTKKKQKVQMKIQIQSGSIMK